MEFTLSKLRIGMAYARLSPWRQAYVEEHWEEVKEGTIAQIECIMRDWPKFDAEYGEEAAKYNVPDNGMSQELRSVQLICAFCFLTEPSYNLYREKNIPLEFWLENMTDLMGHMHDENGKIWMDTLNGEFGWHLSVLNGENIMMGRLQFYPTTCNEDYPEIGLKKGDHMVGFHIPSNGPMTPELCLKAFAIARDYYATEEHRWEFSHFFCESWLFNPIYQKYLPPTSNIVRFQKLGTQLHFPNDSRDAIRRVFSYGHEDINTPTPRSSLQRAVQQILKNGEDISAGAIAFPKEIN